MTTPATPPPAALQAATEALARCLLTDGFMPDREIARAVLEAALPHLARGYQQDAAYVLGVKDEAAAVRARCAELAGSLKFTLYRPAKDGPGGDQQALDVVPLTELLAGLHQEGGST